MIQELNITVCQTDHELLTFEGTPDNLEATCDSAKCFSLAYPDLLVNLWVLGEIAPQVAFAELQSALQINRGRRTGLLRPPHRSYQPT